jgi:hypothetical protein
MNDINLTKQETLDIIRVMEFAAALLGEHADPSEGLDDDDGDVSAEGRACDQLTDCIQALHNRLAE